MTQSPGDRTQAEALRIAEDYLRRMGWRFTPEKVGAIARQILHGLEYGEELEVKR